MFGLSRVSMNFADWQQKQTHDLQDRYSDEVKKMHSLHTQLKKLSIVESYFKADLDSAERPILYFCEPEKPKKRVSLKALEDFKKNEVAPVSRNFRNQMEIVRALHFQCRGCGIDVPRATFDFLDSYKMIKRSSPNKAKKPIGPRPSRVLAA